MKRPTVLQARQARTFQRTSTFEKVRCAWPKMRKNNTSNEEAMQVAHRCISENRFTAHARADGENDFASRNIRNSISLTMWSTRRMICASHQRGA
ncbi:hypothetical protein AYJ54_23080 [Bradyrhizobium centrolobii]|uniref:Uncharacterized protein n=1 Tax=Bradyrhizobium centrolobii TaxID=1505087 RepID=A0A176YE77_9BRAD|nr:hypothetical protein [Bradyrhizobium centrolobii]OAF04908.1 hypothetical protein AYJ54_23080 [Bradyrhizobium centrolobii]